MHEGRVGETLPSFSRYSTITASKAAVLLESVAGLLCHRYVEAAFPIAMKVTALMSHKGDLA